MKVVAVSATTPGSDCWLRSSSRNSRAPNVRPGLSTTILPWRRRGAHALAMSRWANAGTRGEIPHQRSTVVTGLVPVLWAGDPSQPGSIVSIV